MNHANLLPISWQRSSLIRHRLRQWSVVWGVALVSIFATAAGQYWLGRHDLKAIANLEAQAGPVREKIREIDRLRVHLAELKSRESLLSILESNEEPYLLMGLVSLSGQRLAKQLWLNHFKLESTSAMSSASQDRRTATQGGKTPEGKQKEEVRLLLEGNAINDLAVTQFVNDLRQCELFDDVHLISLDVSPGHGGRKFNISCMYEK